MKKAIIFLYLSHLRWWAQLALAIHRPQTIGIAGAIGKSSTKQILHAMLQDQARTVATQGNSETGLPLSILGLNLPSGSFLSWLWVALQAPFSIFRLRGTTYLILEMGTDFPDWPKNMSYLLSIVRPQIAIWLNVHPVHTEQFAAQAPPELDLEQQAEFAIEELANEDGKIITANPQVVGIYNADDPYIGDQILSYLRQEPLGRLMSFGQQPDSEVTYGQHQVSPQGTTFELIVDSQSHQIAINSYLLPQEYQQCLAAALLAGIHLGYSPQDLIQSLQKHFKLDPSRSSVFQGIQDSIIIDSTYNASAASVIAFLSMLSQLKQQTSRPAVAIIGDIREIGPATASEHLRVAQALAEVADQVYLVGQLTKEHIQPYLTQHRPQLPVHWAATYQDISDSIKNELPPQSLILAKGSQNTIFLEEVVKGLLNDSEDATHLCRQEPYWLNRKTAWLKSQSPQSTPQPIDEKETPTQS